MVVITSERCLMQKEMILTYLPEKKDYIKASRTLALKTTSFIIIGLLIFIVAVASVLVLIVPDLSAGSLRSAAFLGLALGAFFIINFWLIIPYQLSKAFKSNETLRKERRLNINDSGLTMHIGENADEFSWDKFQRVIENDGFYLMIYQADEPVYPFIPKRAFEKTGSKEDFLAFLEEKAIPVK